MTGAATDLIPPHRVEKKSMTGPQLLMSCPSGVNPNIVLKNLAIGMTTGAIFCQSPAKNVEIGFQLATIKPAATAMAAATIPMGETRTPMTAVNPIAAVVITVKATAAAARPCTSCGLFATNWPMDVIIGNNAVMMPLTAGINAWPIFSEMASSVALNLARLSEVSPSATLGAFAFFGATGALGITTSFGSASDLGITASFGSAGGLGMTAFLGNGGALMPLAFFASSSSTLMAFFSPS